MPSVSSCVSSLSSSRDLRPSVGPMIMMAIMVIRIMMPRSMLLWMLTMRRLMRLFAMLKEKFRNMAGAYHRCPYDLCYAAPVHNYSNSSCRCSGCPGDSNRPFTLLLLAVVVTLVVATANAMVLATAIRNNIRTLVAVDVIAMLQKNSPEPEKTITVATPTLNPNTP